MGKSLEKGLTNVQAIWLNDGQAKFFAVFNPDQSGHPKGGVIILHDANSHPDKPEVIQPLRNTLPTHGWPSIAIQLPYLASINDYSNKQEIINQRINKAVEHLQTIGIGNIALLGHGTGAMSAAAYLSSQPSPTIQAFIGISLGMLKKENEAAQISQQIEKITVPILDIYGSNDLDLVLKGEKDKANPARKAGNKKYTQIEVIGANHFFDNKDEVLVKRVRGWLAKNAAGTEIKINN